MQSNQFKMFTLAICLIFSWKKLHKSLFWPKMLGCAQFTASESKPVAQPLLGQKFESFLLQMFRFILIKEPLCSRIRCHSIWFSINLVWKHVWNLVTWSSVEDILKETESEVVWTYQSLLCEVHWTCANSNLKIQENHYNYQYDDENNDSIGIINTFFLSHFSCFVWACRLQVDA